MLLLLAARTAAGAAAVTRPLVRSMHSRRAIPGLARVVAQRSALCRFRVTGRLRRDAARYRDGRAPSAPDPPPLTPARPGHSRSLRAVDMRARRSSVALAIGVSAQTLAFMGERNSARNCAALLHLVQPGGERSSTEAPHTAAFVENQHWRRCARAAAPERARWASPQRRFLSCGANPSASCPDIGASVFTGGSRPYRFISAWPRRCIPGRVRPDSWLRLGPAAADPSRSW
jgi:hypothetical protein